MQLLTTTPTTRVSSHVAPWLAPLLYPLANRIVLPSFFNRIEVNGQENLPKNDCPVILAPTHRSRWDPLIIAHAAGYPVTGRHLHFMASANETSRGVQGWLIRKLGAFPIDPKQPGVGSLRHGLELLQTRQVLTIFPEGDLYPGPEAHPLKLGLARLALQAETSQARMNVRIVPIGVSYRGPLTPKQRPTWGCDVQVNIGEPILVRQYLTGSMRRDSYRLTVNLQQELDRLNGCAIVPSFALSA
ncbi:MAG: 1-acyl-sn-glycerol-3-phosphate acyltransferase [Oscillatoriales cyanobacterium]|nr:MAG: 1-acyl-sn-glycerol-3-phosphate acyltransferase [Oscillatoriales cyanobacterium]